MASKGQHGTSGDGLMVFWASIEQKHWLEYQQWHNCEHIPERVAIEGFRSGRRYRDALRPDRFMMFYETAGSVTLASPAYLHALQNPTPWTRRALQWFREPSRSVYVLESSVGARPTNESPLLIAIRYDEPGASSQTTLAAGVRRVRHYVLDPSASNVVTSERAIHGAAPSPRSRLALVEYSDPALLRHASDAAPTRGDLLAAAGAPASLDCEAELYWLEIVLHSNSAVAGRQGAAA